MLAGNYWIVVDNFMQSSCPTRVTNRIVLIFQSTLQNRARCTRTHWNKSKGDHNKVPLAALKYICCLTEAQKQSPGYSFPIVFYQAEEFVVAQHARKFSVTLKELKEVDVIWENTAVGKTTISRKQARAGHWEHSDIVLLQWMKQRWNLDSFHQRLHAGKMWSGVCNFTLALKEQALQHLSQESTCQSHSGLAWFEGAVNAFKLDHDEERPKPNNVPIKYVKHLEVKRRTNYYSSSGILFCNVPKYDPRIYQCIMTTTYT